MPTVNRLWLLLLLLGQNNLWAAESSPTLQIDTKLQSFRDPLGGVDSRYTEILSTRFKSLPKPFKAELSDSNPIHLHCFSTPAQPYYIGVQEEMRIEAPLETADHVVSDIGHYQEIFPGYKDIHVVRKEGNRWLTYWEQRIPLFFISNVRYELWYVIDHHDPKRIIYRFQLAKADKVHHSDGIIVLEPLGPHSTQYTEYDFWDADFGLLKTLAPGRIWRESIEGVYLSDLALKFKAEHPQWSASQIQHEAKKQLDRFPVDQAIADRVEFSGL